MKVTLDIDDELLAKAEAMAEQNRTTLDALIELGLAIVCNKVRSEPVVDRRSDAMPN